MPTLTCLACGQTFAAAEGSRLAEQGRCLDCSEASSRPSLESGAATTFCPSCGQSAAPDAGFCPGCGQELGGLDYAGLGIRFAAHIIDTIILVIPSIVLQLALEAPAGNLLSIAVGFAYLVGFWTARGATPGKMVMGIEIITVDGEDIDSGTALLRYIGYWVSVITLGFGFLMIANTSQKRGLHDYIAGTVVIKTR